MIHLAAHAGIAILILAALASCAADGTLRPQGQAAVTVLCALDVAGQPLAAAVTAVSVPQAAGAIAIDQMLVHPLVIQACKDVGGLPTAVVQPRPEGATRP